MPTPRLEEGFYWVRYRDPALSAEVLPRVFVCERFAHTWWEPGNDTELDGRLVEAVSARLEPPAFDLEGRAVKVSTAAWPEKRPRVVNHPATQQAEATGRSRESKARSG